MNRSIIFAALALICVNATAQEHKWTLSECMDYALEHNISLKQSANSAQIKQIELETAEGRMLPAISAGASQNFSFGRGLTADNTYSNANTTSTSLQLGGEIPLFQGLQISGGIKLARLELESALADLEKARDDIRVAVAKCYVQILYDYEIRDVASQQVELDSRELERIIALQQNGKASYVEVSEQRATLGQSRYSLSKANGNLSQSKLELSQLLELPGAEGFDVVRPRPETIETEMLPSVQTVYLAALYIKPRILADSIRVNQALKNIDLAKGYYLPTLSLSGGIGSNYYTTSLSQSKGFGSQLENNFSQYVGLSLNIPIFSRFQTRDAVRTAKLNYSNQLLELDKTKKNLYKEIQQAYCNAANSQSRFTAAQQARQSAKESFDLVLAKFQEGKADNTEYNKARTQYLSAESDYIQAEYEMLFQTRMLYFYQGQEIVL